MPWPIVFAQDIPQEAETTGNVCPAPGLFHAYMHTYSTYVEYRRAYSGFALTHTVVYSILSSVTWLSIKSGDY